MTNLPKNPAECRILILHDDAHSYFELLKQRFPTIQIELCETAETVEPMVAAVRPNVIFSWKSIQIPPTLQREILVRPEVEWVQIGGAGFDHLQPLDMTTAIFTNTAGILSDFLAETVLGAILMMNFGFPHYFRQQQAHKWRQLKWASVAGKTVLIIGLGNIGAKVARKVKLLGMRTLGMRRDQTPVEDIDEMLPLSQLAEALPRADFVCLHVPLTEATRHLIGAEELCLMRPDAILLNTARGGVVDEAALVEAMGAGGIGGAYLDVFEQEPLPSDSPLWDLPNVVISPHYSDSVSDWEQRFAHFFGDNLVRWLAGHPLLNVVDVKRGY